MKTANILIAGFGGQGALFAGKFLAYSAMLEGRELSWLPSYGPEMRGGTANCSVIISDSPVGTPIVSHPDILIAMNKPSFDKYVPECVPGAKVIYDSTLIDSPCDRDDVEFIPVPATELARGLNIASLSNIILVGKMLKETGVINYENVPTVLSKLIPAKKAAMIELNQLAVKTGYEY
ncbi:MAG: 2-oxoacid:acceptor oxidoreductase family protein [Eubacteriales bacterium]|nr:2-oxoacid:acceptor oxidoreductase family protein [Eubacteriales bacterium]